MKNKRALFVVGLTVLVAFVFAAWARADVYMKQKTRTGAFKMMGQTQPEKDEIMVYWLSGQKARTDMASGTSMLFDAEKNVLYAIDHNKKQYSEISMNIDKMFEEAIEDEEDKAEAKKMAEMMKGMANAMMAQMPGFEKMAQEMKKVKGVIVQQTAVTKMMGADVTVSTEVIEYEEKSAPAGTFVIPAGYKKVKNVKS